MNSINQYVFTEVLLERLDCKDSENTGMNTIRSRSRRKERDINKYLYYTWCHNRRMNEVLQEY